MIHVTSIFKDGKATSSSIKKINDKKMVGLVDVINPTKEELKELSKSTGIDVYDLKDFTDLYSRAKVGDLEKASFIIFQYPAKVNKTWEARSFGIIISKTYNYCIVLQEKEDEVSKIIKSFDEKIIKKILAHGVGYFVYILLDNVVNEYYKLLDKLDEDIDKIEIDVLERPHRKQVYKIFSLKKTLIYLHKALMANREVISSIEKKYITNIDDKTIKRFRNTYNDIIEIIDLGETHRDILTGALDVYLSSISNNMNDIMKRLTVLGAFVWIPTLIAGIYGMNFITRHPYNMPELLWEYGYIFSLILMILSVAITWGYFKAKKWI